MKRFFTPALVALAVFAGQAAAQSRSGENQASDSAGRGQTNPASPAERTQPSGAQSTARPGAAGQTAGGQQDLLEQHIAAGLLLGNQEEIALSQFGLQRAEHDQVKQFAQSMIEQHQQAVSQIQQAAPQLASMNLELRAAQGATAGGGQRSTESNRSATGGADASSTLGGATSSAGAQRGATASAGQGGQAQQMAQYMRDVKERCLALTAQQLSRQQGAEFDKAFMGMQIALHTSMLAHLQAAEGRVSGQMQPIIQQGTEMTQHHLTQAQQIMEQLAGASGQGGTRAAAGQGETSRQ